MHDLIEKLFIPAFVNSTSSQRHDGAVLSVGNTRIAFTTDSYVVRPLFFPGGDIGSLAVHGTVNDLAMCGARPLFMSCGLILEEGFPMETLQKVVQSMAHAAGQAGITLVTGDTKVVDKGKGDGLFINTSGIGILEYPVHILPSEVRTGDAVLVSGDLGRHGIAIMAVREGLSFESAIESDSAPLWKPVEALLQAGIEIHCLRDLTRGGLSSALNEIAEASGEHISVDEALIPVREDVRGACEMLGLDPLYVANEGRFVAFVKEADGKKALKILKKHCVDAAVIGKVEGLASAESAPNLKRSDYLGQTPVVTLKSRIGATRILDMLTGEQLPRIC
jgi:hydrogenase expression/formation protein HypE